jgi:hypothetical protein
MLVQYLRHLNDLQQLHIMSFFDGTDPQNVPMANAFLTYLHRASQLPTIASQSENESYLLLGEVIGSLVLPYTIPTMTLAKQVTGSSMCVHCIYALYCIDGTKLLPWQLIYDFQATIENVVFYAAKTQLVDRKLPFYPLQTGVNRLAGQLSMYRIITGDRNGNLPQMTQRARSIEYVDKTFSTLRGWN